MTPTSGPAGFRLLFVCTGNICRSATAERLARRRLQREPGREAALVHVESAGTRAVVGAPVHPHSTVVLRDLGGDAEGYAARQLHRSIVADADLILTMTRRHREAVLGLDPRALSRTFTLREASDLMDLLEPAPAPGEGTLSPLSRRMADARALRVTDGRDDIVDPIDGPLEVHREIGAVIQKAVDRVLDRILDDLRARSLAGPAAD